MSLSGCSNPQLTGGTFLQPWQEHMNWPLERWRSVLAGNKELGCSSLFLQWVALEGESSTAWDARGRMLQTLLDESARLGIGVHIGLPYNQNWWTAIDQSNPDQVYNYMQMIGQSAVAYMRSVNWQQHAAFAGWYVPYELEQYNWARTSRIDIVADWLKMLSDVSIETCGREPTVSTYFSEIAEPQALANMWDYLLDRAVVRPMVQDGVGVHGLGNYQNLEPLHQALLRRGAYFDLVVELFERDAGAANVAGAFSAHTANLQRLRSQWGTAQGYGAQRIVAFALEPWASQDTPTGKELRKVWKASMTV